jgi:hypothetical protein
VQGFMHVHTCQPPTAGPAQSRLTAGIMLG